jgi:hypothetical protein
VSEGSEESKNIGTMNQFNQKRLGCDAGEFGSIGEWDDKQLDKEKNLCNNMGGQSPILLRGTNGKTQRNGT